MLIKVKSGLYVKLNENNFTANIAKSPDIRNDVIIPQNIRYNSHEYQIIEVESNAFEDTMISSVKFNRNSRVKKISKNSFDGSSIQQLQLPSNLENLEEGWCAGTNNLIDIKISPSNKFFKYINNQLLININANHEKILFSRRDIEAIDIPNNIKRIGSFSFSDCTRLQSVTFSTKIIEEIGESAFFSCSKLREISIPSSVKRIEKEAFAFCEELEKITFDDDSNLKTISKGAFKGSSIQKLFLPASLENLEEGWCSGCNKLIEIKISKENKNFIFIEKKFLIQLKPNENDQQSTDWILTFVSRDIETATLSSKITKIGESSFEGCIQMNSLKFELNSKLNEIADFAFNSCVNLHNISSIPPSIKRIGNSAFANCYKLDFFYFDENSKIETICQDAFKFSAINHLFLPPSLNALEEGWCTGTSRLTDLTVASENKHFSYIDEDFLVRFDIEKNKTFLLFARRNIESIFVPPNINRICISAFYNCRKLQSVTFSENSKLEEICRSAFNGCLKLKSISSIPDSVKSIQRRCFNLVVKLASIEFLASEVKIDENSFEYCSQLFLASFPNATRLTIDWRGFYGVSRNFSLFILHDAEVISH